MKYELHWKLLYIKTAISQSCLLITSRLNIFLLYMVNWQILMHSHRTRWKSFGNRLSSLLSFGRLKLYFGSYANHLFLCYVCFCAAHHRLGFEHRQFCTTALIFMFTLAVWSRLLTHGSLKSYESKYIHKFLLDKILTTPTIVQCIKPPK